MVDIDLSIARYDLNALKGGAGLKSPDFSQTITRNGFAPGDLVVREEKRLRDRQRRDAKQRQKAKRAQERAVLDAAIAEERIGHECSGSCPTCIDDRFGWYVIASFIHLIEQAITAQSHRAGRYVSTWDADLYDLTTERLHHELLRQRTKEREEGKCWGSEVIVEAATWLGKQGNLPGNVYAEQVGSEVVAECAMWLLSVTYNAVLDAIRTWLRRYSTADGDQLVRFEAVEASGTFYGADEFLSHHKVDDLTMHGHRYPRPGAVNKEYLATAISAWITERKLDPVTEVLLNDEWLNTDGTFRWTEHADKVWAACGLPMAAFELLPNDKAKADAARKAARNRYADLPEAIGRMMHALGEYEVDLGERGDVGFIKVTQHVSVEAQAKEVAAALLLILESL
jgi:hypothetical protein